MHQIDPESETITFDNDSLYPYVNNDIEYRLFEDIVDSYYLDSQIKDDFQCDHACYSQHKDPTIDDHSNTCTHDYHHITQSVQDLSDSTQQNNLHSIQYHDFDNQDSLTFTDKYAALLQQELQNPYWNLHDPNMDIEMMPHAMYFTGDLDTVTKINHVAYQTIVYHDNGMFTAKLMNNTPIEIFIDNGATPSILPLHTYNRFPIYIRIQEQKVILPYIQEEV